MTWLALPVSIALLGTACGQSEDSGVELDREQARRIGPLLAVAHASDVVDGSVADIARDGDEILTGDPADIARLVAASGKVVTVTPV